MNKILKQIVRDLSKVTDVLGIILYGSFARGEATSRSDIDLLILVTDKKAAIKIENAIIKLEKDIDRAIQPTIRVVSQLDKTDSGLIQNIFQEGKVLYLREPIDVSSSLILEKKPYSIYTFRIDNLSQNKKAIFNNDLYHRTKGRYNYEGLLKQFGGEKLSSGCILVPHNKTQLLEKFFRKFKVKFAVFKILK